MVESPGSRTDSFKAPRPPGSSEVYENAGENSHFDALERRFVDDVFKDDDAFWLSLFLGTRISLPRGSSSFLAGGLARPLRRRSFS
jgi:hypothetical protein